MCYEALKSTDFRYESIENHPKVLILQGFYGSGRRSRKFESCHLDQIKKSEPCARIFLFRLKPQSWPCDFTSRATKLYHRALCLERDHCLWQMKGARQGKKQGESQPAGRESTMFLTERGRRSRAKRPLILLQPKWGVEGADHYR